MATITITVFNPLLSRKWGFGYETQPERHSTRIVPPTRPDHTGTLKQVRAAIENDRTFASLKSGGTFYSARWFYDGKPIVGLGDGNEYPGTFSEWLNELDYERDWRKREGYPSTYKPLAVTLTLEVSETYAAAHYLGSRTSVGKSAAARVNGRKGGRPRKATS